MRNFVRTILFFLMSVISNFSIAQEVSPSIFDTKCMRPEYPRSSLRNEETGTVYFALLVDVDGTVVDSKINQTSGYRQLDKAALTAALLCKFIVGTKDGNPEKMWVTWTYTFHLPRNL